MICRVFDGAPGTPLRNYAMFERAWHEFPELQVRPKDEWIGRSIASLAALQRWEIGAFNDAGETIGGIVLAEDPWDCHVGPCVSVFAQYVVPEYRDGQVSQRMMREALRLARSLHFPVLAFTHRRGPWRYETIYHRIKHRESSEGGHSRDGDGAEGNCRGPSRRE